MRLEELSDLRAEVRTIGDFLAEELLRLLETEFREAVEAWPERSRSEEVPLPRREIRQLPDRFWRAALKGESRFFSAGRPPVKLLRGLHARWIDLLRSEAEPCFCPELQDLRGRFPDILALDGGTLDDISRRLHLVEGEGMVLVPGAVSTLFDVFRGLPLRIWYSPDAEAVDLAPATEIARTAGSGALLLADIRHSSPQLIAALRETGASCVFRIRPEPSAGGRLGPLGIEDREVSFPEANGGRVMRRITAVQKGRVIGIVTDVLDRTRLPASDGLLLASPRWRIDRFLADAATIVDLGRVNLEDPAAIEAQMLSAALMASGLRTAQGWVAGQKGLPATAIAGKLFFPRIAEKMAERAAMGVAEKTEKEAVPSARSDISTIRTKIRPPIPAPPRIPAPAPREVMGRIAQTEVDAGFEPFCRKYGDVGHRNQFLWKWVQKGVTLVAFPSVVPELLPQNRLSKLLGVMLDVLLDDVADNCNYKDRQFLDDLLAIPFGDGRVPERTDPSRLPYFRFTAEVWNEISRLTTTFPRYEEFRDIFEFDVRQFLNTMRYAFLVNRIPDLLNSTEHDLYQPHNMYMMIFGTLDIMCSPGFDRSELRLVRQATWYGQVMGRIGNMVSTWEREIRERDFTSGVFAAAIERGAFRANEMPLLDPLELTAAIERSGVVEAFLERWALLRDAVLEIADRVRSVDLHPVLAGLEELITLHLGSKGLK